MTQSPADTAAPDIREAANLKELRRLLIQYFPAFAEEEHVLLMQEVFDFYLWVKHGTYPPR